MVSGRSDQRHPFVSLILLLAFVFVGAIIFTLIGAIAGGVIFGLPDLMRFFGGDMAANIELVKLIQIFSSIGMFVVPAIVFARVQQPGGWLDYLKLESIQPVLALLTVVLMFSSLPLIELFAVLNEQMNLPDFMNGLESWMKSKEDQMAELTRQLLVMNSVNALLLNLLMLAVIPAIGEEFIFRGCLQRIFLRMTNKNHLAIWLTAIVFSAIHVQFFGFLPRMLLGALFGYLLVWSNNLWLPIIAHFINNATAVITAYIFQQQGKSFDEITVAEPSGWPIYLLSFLATASLIWYFRKIALQNTHNPLTYNGAGLD